MAKVECALWYSRRDQIPMTKQCEQQGVRLGTEECAHFVGEVEKRDPEAKNVTDVCQRAQNARKLGPIDAEK